jgi:hypothetical protein
LISWLPGFFCLLVAGGAAAGRRELAEQPQQQERLARHPHLTDSRLPEPSQPCQQLVASHGAGRGPGGDELDFEGVGVG